MGEHLKEQSGNLLYGTPEAPQRGVKLTSEAERLLLATVIDGFRTLIAELAPEHRREDSCAQLQRARRYSELLEARLRERGKGSDLQELNEWNAEGQIFELVCSALENAARQLARVPAEDSDADDAAFRLLVGAFLDLSSGLEKIESRAPTREAYWIRWRDDFIEGNAPDWEEAEDE